MTQSTLTHAAAIAAAARPVAVIPAHITKQTKYVFTDMDSTIGLFWSYYCPGIREYIDLMVERHGVNKTELEREIGRVTHQHGTHEYGWMMEMTKFRKEFKGTPAEFRDQWVIPFWKCLDDNRKKFLRPFRDVMETLHELKQRGVTVVIVSDAPFFMGLTRACDMKLDTYVDGIFALDCPLPDVSQFVDPEDMAYGVQRIKDLEARAHKFNVAVTLPKSCEKPNTGGVLAAMQAYPDATVDNSIFVGDNLKKDGGVAQTLGMRFIWASYGLWLPPEYEDIIDARITPTGQMPTNGHGVGYRPSVYPPMVEDAGSYKAILNHLGEELLPTAPTTLNPSTETLVTDRNGH
ncbi:MAG: HAD hydrolase-like protein [Cyanobacteria bacterium REEB67]|nr:HAD hydrolase-like protein [Cyanobacteria bacterium REEB67]